MNLLGSAGVSLDSFSGPKETSMWGFASEEGLEVSD